MEGQQRQWRDDSAGTLNSTDKASRASWDAGGVGFGSPGAAASSAQVQALAALRLSPAGQSTHSSFEGSPLAAAGHGGHPWQLLQEQVPQGQAQLLGSPAAPAAAQQLAAFTQGLQMQAGLQDNSSGLLSPGQSSDSAQLMQHLQPGRAFKNKAAGYGRGPPTRT